MLHPVEEVASFPQPVGCAALSGGGLFGAAVLLFLGVLHVLGGFFQPVEGLLQLRSGHRTTSAGLSRLLAGLLTRLAWLPLLSRLPWLSLLALLAGALLLRRLAPLELLHLLLELLGFTAQHLLLPTLAERLLLILLFSQLLLTARKLGQLLHGRWPLLASIWLGE